MELRICSTYRSEFKDIYKFTSLEKDKQIIAHFWQVGSVARQTIINIWLVRSPVLSGIVCAYHLAALGSSPKHAIYAFSFIVFVLYLSCEKNENKQKSGRVWPILTRSPVGNLFSSVIFYAKHNITFESRSILGNNLMQTIMD